MPKAQLCIWIAIVSVDKMFLAMKCICYQFQSTIYSKEFTQEYTI